MTTDPMTAASNAAWTDGDPLMETMAAALWAHCFTENTVIADDPRNIAAVAAAVARAMQPALVDRAAVEPMTDDQAAALLAPLEAKARALRAEKDAQLRDAAFAEAATVADRIADESREKRFAEGQGKGSTALGARLVAEKLRGMTDSIPGCPQHPDAYGYEHPDCGFHWHGRDPMDIPMRDGQPVCPRCELRRMADEEQQPETQAEAPPVAYGDGKGRVYCLACPRPADPVPLTVEDVDHWELCPSCGRHVVDVARATAPAVVVEPGKAAS